MRVALALLLICFEGLDLPMFKWKRYSELQFARCTLCRIELKRGLRIGNVSSNDRSIFPNQCTGRECDQPHERPKN
jgi:hypothetical protein